MESWLTGREQRVLVDVEGRRCTPKYDKGACWDHPFCLFSSMILYLAALLVTLLKKSADDTKLGQIIRNHKDTLNLQAKLNSLMDLEAKWGMAFNGFYIKKRKVMHMGRQNQDSII
jgi:hypothetical protein